MDQQELNGVLQEIIREARELKIPVSSSISREVTINGRPKKRFGCCHKEGSTYRIEVSAFVLACSEEHIRTVVAHEVLHTCPGCGNHGKLWKSYAAMMNRACGYHIKSRNTFTEMGLEEPEPSPGEGRIRYVMVCRSCGREYPRQRYTCVMKKINAYRCQCGGRLDVYEVKYRDGR